MTLIFISSRVRGNLGVINIAEHLVFLSLKFFQHFHYFFIPSHAWAVEFWKYLDVENFFNKLQCSLFFQPLQKIICTKYFTDNIRNATSPLKKIDELQFCYQLQPVLTSQKSPLFVISRMSFVISLFAFLQNQKKLKFANFSFC